MEGGGGIMNGEGGGRIRREEEEEKEEEDGMHSRGRRRRRRTRRTGCIQNEYPHIGEWWEKMSMVLQAKTDQKSMSKSIKKRCLSRSIFGSILMDLGMGNESKLVPQGASYLENAEEQNALIK